MNFWGCGWLHAIPITGITPRTKLQGHRESRPIKLQMSSHKSESQRRPENFQVKIFTPTQSSGLTLQGRACCEKLIVDTHPLASLSILELFGQ
jgi:hypothetical protein